MWTKFENWTGGYIFALSKNGTEAGFAGQVFQMIEGA